MLTAAYQIEWTEARVKNVSQENMERAAKKIVLPGVKALDVRGQLDDALMGVYQTTLEERVVSSV